MPYFCLNSVLKFSAIFLKTRHAQTFFRGVTRSTQILEDLNWLPIEIDLKKRETLMTFKALTGQAPGYLTLWPPCKERYAAIETTCFIHQNCAVLGEGSIELELKTYEGATILAIITDLG